MAENIGIYDRDTIGNAIWRWLYKYKQKSVKTATFNRLIASYNLLRNYNISEVKIVDLCTDDIQRFINALTDHGYSISTIKKAYNLMTGFIRFAMGEGLTIRPAHINVMLPKQEAIKQVAREVIAYEPDEQDRLRKAIQENGTMCAYAILMMLETGARVGEVLALRWTDVLWQRKAIRIHATLVNPTSRKKCFVQNSAKSRSSNRTIPLSVTAQKLLSGHRQSGDGLIFTRNAEGSPIDYNVVRKMLQDLCKDAKIPYYGMHALRHTFATNAFYKGCEIKILSKLLGHASVTITYNTYIHLYGDALEEMRSIVG